MGEQSIQLRPGEELKMQEYIYNLRPFLCTYVKEKTHMVLTNQRIHLTIQAFREVVLEVADIERVEKCTLGRILQMFPVGILITMKDGKQYKFSVLERDQLINEMNNLIK